MKFSLKLVPALVFITILSATSVRAEETKNVSVKNFTEITVSSGIDLYLTQGNTENLTIKADADLIKNIVVEQRGNSLKIRYKDAINWSSLFKNKSAKVYINFKALHSISASGGSDVYTLNLLKTTHLSAQASGGSDLKLNLDCKDFQLHISGGSDADLKGRAENMDAAASGGSDINAFGFAVNYAKVHASGGSDANLYVNKGLEASANGGSDINYKGNASVKKTGSSSSVDIRRIR